MAEIKRIEKKTDWNGIQYLPWPHETMRSHHEISPPIILYFYVLYARKSRAHSGPQKAPLLFLYFRRVSGPPPPRQ